MSDSRSDSSVKEVLRVFFVGVNWASMMVYADEFMVTKYWKGQAREEGLIALFAFVVILTLVGNLAAILDSFIAMIIFLIGWGGLYIANALLMYRQHPKYIVPIVMGGIAFLIGLGYCIAIYGAGKKS